LAQKFARPRTQTLPDVQPILLTPRAEPFDDPDWLFEPKYDDSRRLLYVTGQQPRFGHAHPL
jgi:hypothetical protein